VNDVSTMDHKTATGTLRRLEFHNEGSPEERLALAVRALETSSSEWRHVWLRRVDLYSRGRTVKVMVGDITSLDGVDVTTIDEINAVEREMERNEGEQS
jgi:hypothetical protein